jgi:hypothetical protein
VEKCLKNGLIWRMDIDAACPQFGRHMMFYISRRDNGRASQHRFANTHVRAIAAALP